MNDASVDLADLPPAERLHPLYLVTGLGKVLRNAWGILAGGAVLASRDRWSLALLLVGAGVLVSLASLFIKWLKLEYRVGRDEIRIDTGLLNRNSRVIPFDRITDIDIEQGPLHRLFGLARVRFETGASAGGKGEDGVLDTIALPRAEALREHVRARRQGVAVEAATDRAQPAEVSAPVYAMDSGRVLRAGIFNFSLAIIAGLFGASQTIGDVVGFDPFKRSFWEGLVAEAGPLRELIAAHQILTVIAGIVSLGAIGLLTGLVRTVLREHGFRLDRTESGFRRRRGLLTLTDVSIPQKRVQAAILATGPIKRRFGWWTVKLQSLAQDGGQGDHVVAPLATMNEAATINESIDLPSGPRAEPFRPVARAYVWSMLPLLLPATLIGGVGSALGAPLALLWVAGALFMIALRFGEWRHIRYALDGGHLFIERGWWRHRRLVLPVRRIQSIDIAENFWGRKLGYVSVQLGVAGGKGLSIHGIPALSRVDAEALRGQLLEA